MSGIVVTASDTPYPPPYRIIESDLCIQKPTWSAGNVTVSAEKGRKGNHKCRDLISGWLAALAIQFLRGGLLVWYSSSSEKRRGWT